MDGETMGFLRKIVADEMRRIHYRMRNIVSRVTLGLGDDTNAAAQTHQVTAYETEVHAGVQRLGEFGHSSMPLPGAAGVALFQGGHRGFGTIVGTEDPRYRPTGLQPGEHVVYYVDGAAADGTGGTMRHLVEGRLGGITKVPGINIEIGDSTATAVTVTCGTLVLTMQGGVVTIGNGGTPQFVKLADGSTSTTLKAQ